MEELLDPRWRKTSYSGNGGVDCVEVGTAWRKASYSSNGGDSCVEAGNAPGGVLVRDTTDRGGAVLSIPADAWERFTDGLK
jgi:Domain of unknown function (DUF397)